MSAEPDRSEIYDQLRQTRAEALRALQESCESIASHCDIARAAELATTKELARVIPVRLTIEDVAFFLKKFRSSCREHAQRYEIIGEQIRAIVQCHTSILEQLDAAEGSDE